MECSFAVNRLIHRQLVKYPIKDQIFCILDVKIRINNSVDTCELVSNKKQGTHRKCM